MTLRAVKIFAVVFLLFLGCADGQMNTGTAVIAIGTPTDAIVAMDTLVGTPSLNTQTHNVCKLQQRGNTLLAVFGVGVQDSGPIFQSSRYDEEFGQVRTVAQLAIVVEKWSKMARALYEDEFRRDSNVNVETDKDGGFARASFFATDSSGNLISETVGFGFLKSASPAGHSVGMGLKTLPPSIFDKSGNFILPSAKAYDMYQELKENKSPRAKKNQKILLNLTSAKTIEQKKKALNAAIQLTADWFPKDVGMPAEIARVSDGHIDWLQKSHDCVPMPGSHL
jgi:hypothetical protein